MITAAFRDQRNLFPVNYYHRTVNLITLRLAFSRPLGISARTSTTGKPKQSNSPELRHHIYNLMCVVLNPLCTCFLKLHLVV